MKIYGVNKVARESQIRCSRGFLPIYYNMKTQTVSTDPDDGGYKVTELIRPNTADEIAATIRRWLMM